MIKCELCGGPTQEVVQTIINEEYKDQITKKTLQVCPYCNKVVNGLFEDNEDWMNSLLESQKLI